MGFQHPVLNTVGWIRLVLYSIKLNSSERTMAMYYLLADRLRQSDTLSQSFRY